MMHNECVVHRCIWKWASIGSDVAFRAHTPSTGVTGVHSQREDRECKTALHYAAEARALNGLTDYAARGV